MHVMCSCGQVHDSSTQVALLRDVIAAPSVV